MDYTYIQKNKGVLNDDQWHERVNECSLKCNDNIFIEDRLEKGFIKIYVILVEESIFLMVYMI